MDILTDIAILVLAAFVGFEVISKVPNTLHTPLMSGTNAIHGIVLLGGLLVLSSAVGALNKVLLVIAITFGTINIIRRVLATGPVVEMVKGRGGAPKPRQRGALESEGGDPVALRGDHRVDLLLGLEHRVREAPGDPARAADPASRPARHQRPPALGGGGERRDPRHRDALPGAVHPRDPRDCGDPRQHGGA